MSKMELASEIKRLLTADKWKFSFDEERCRFMFGLSTDGKIKNLSYHIMISDISYTVLAVCPIGADADDKKLIADMAEYLTRANYGLKNGNFEIDFRDGEIRYKSFVDCEESPFTKEVFLNSISIPSLMFNRYGGGIIDLLFGRKTPKQAIGEAEASVNNSTLPAESGSGTDSVISAILEGLEDGEDDE